MLNDIVFTLSQLVYSHALNAKLLKKRDKNEKVNIDKKREKQKIAEISNSFICDKFGSFLK